MYDVSNRRRIEEQMLHSQKMEAVGHLAGSVAHDFNNLLTAIMGHCQMGMRAQSAGGGLSTTLPAIQEAAERGAGLCRQLLVFSRRQGVEPRVITLNDLVLEMGELVRLLIGEDIALTIRHQSDLGLVRVDSGQFEQVLINLALNASDAMPAGGTLTIETSNVTVDQGSTRRSAGAAVEYVSVGISDTGVGIPDDVKPHIFEPFFTTKGSGKGTGLGLFTCHGIVSQNNGYITVQSEPGKGSTFRILLPRVDEPAPAVAARHEYVSLPRGSETVLLVEDEEVVREVAARILREQGYTVLEAADGVQALGLARGNTHRGVDLLFTDVVMPVMSGSELADRLREYQPGIRVLYTSGYAGDTIRQIELQERATAFIEKPFTAEELAQNVRAVLES